MTRADEIMAAGRGELATLGNQLAQAYVQLAGCLCAAEGSGDAASVKQGEYAWTPALQKTVALRAELEAAEMECAIRKNAEAVAFAKVESLILELTEARAALNKAKESAPFFLHDELQHLRTSNHYMIEELTRLRAERKAESLDLAEARADVQRFEAQLDAANRELAQARALADGWHRSATYYKGGFMSMGSAWYDETKRKAEKSGQQAGE